MLQIVQGEFAEYREILLRLFVSFDKRPETADFAHCHKHKLCRPRHGVSSLGFPIIDGADTDAEQCGDILPRQP